MLSCLLVSTVAHLCVAVCFSFTSSGVCPILLELSKQWKPSKSYLASHRWLRRLGSSPLLGCFTLSSCFSFKRFSALFCDDYIFTLSFPLSIQLFVFNGKTFLSKVVKIRGRDKNCPICGDSAPLAKPLAPVQQQPQPQAAEPTKDKTMQKESGSSGVASHA